MKKNILYALLKVRWCQILHPLGPRNCLSMFLLQRDSTIRNSSIPSSLSFSPAHPKLRKGSKGGGSRPYVRVMHYWPLYILCHNQRMILRESLGEKNLVAKAHACKTLPPQSQPVIHPVLIALNFCSNHRSLQNGGCQILHLFAKWGAPDTPFICKMRGARYSIF